MKAASGPMAAGAQARPAPPPDIPSNRPYMDDRVLEYIARVMRSGKLSGDGEMCRRVETRLKALVGAESALLTTSCTHALEMSMMLLDLQPGDEVITPSFTFVSAANAILHAGGIPVFCEIDERTLTIDVADAERRITPRTRAIMPMHYAGVAADMDGVMALASAHGLMVVEDAAQGVNAKYKGRFLGTIGHCGAYSFHETKNVVSGEGGAFVTSDGELARRAEIVREKGTNRARFLRGEVDKYTWVDKGSSYVLSDILAAVLEFQLDQLDTIQTRRKILHGMYMAGLRGLEQRGRLHLPVIPEGCESNYHIFYVLLRSEEERHEVISEMRRAGIGVSFHYVPLHSAPYALKRLGSGSGRLPVTDRLAGTLMRLPLYPSLTDGEVAAVIGRLHEVLH